jgi:hypothetical protein
MTERVEESILNNMGSLEEYLSGKDYGNAVVTLNADGTIARDENNTALINDPGQHPLPAGPGVGQGQVPGVVPQPVPAQPVQQQPAITPQMYHAAVYRQQQLEAAAAQATREKLEADDRAFLAEISHLDEDDQRIKLYERYIQQLDEANQGLAAKMQAIEAQDEEMEQNAAKGRVATNKMLAAGLMPALYPDLRAALMDVETPQAMDRLVNTARRYVGANAPQPGAAPPPQTRARTAAGQYVAGPGRGTTNGTAPTVKEGSGNLSGYLKGKPYQIA